MNEKNYKRIEQETVQCKNVEESTKRFCNKCGDPGITLQCVKCIKWFHFNVECHYFGSCAGRNPNNQYEQLKS